ncbi:MAG: hypothetical protein E7311_02610 [Clostridiales bacterium]|nr:hypothetical protein [Clostridiales bacterium]
MDKNIQIGLLYEFYGNLLTEKQAYVINSYYNDDLSLSEIADELEITRQGVRKHLIEAEKLLNNYEEKLGLMNKFLENKNELKYIYEELNKLKNKYNDENINILSARISKLI